MWTGKKQRLAPGALLIVWPGYALCECRISRSATNTPLGVVRGVYQRRGRMQKSPEGKSGVKFLIVNCDQGWEPLLAHGAYPRLTKEYPRHARHQGLGYQAGIEDHRVIDMFKVSAKSTTNN